MSKQTRPGAVNAPVVNSLSAPTPMFTRGASISAEIRLVVNMAPFSQEIQPLTDFMFISFNLANLKASC